MKSDGTWPVRLTENQGRFFALSSPDGQRILYTASTGRKSADLRIIDVAAVIAAAANDNRKLYSDAAGAIRAQAVELDRDDLKTEIVRRRYPFHSHQLDSR